MTPAGKAYFDALASVHHGWIEAMFADLSPSQRELMFDLLGALKVSITHANPGEMP